MKTLLTLSACSFLALGASAADDAAADIKAAAKKLADQPNYSWTSTTKSESQQRFRIGPTEGKIEKDGWLHTKSSFGDSDYETVRKGDKGAVKREDEWRTLKDLEEDDRGAFFAQRVRNFKAPATEAEDLVGQTKGLKKGDGGVFSGDMTEEGAQARLSFGGRRPNSPAAKDAKGSAKFWIKDGVISKYEYTVSGSVKRPDNDEEFKMDRTVTVEIKDVGTTKVSVPDEVKKKLS